MTAIIRQWPTSMLVGCLTQEHRLLERLRQVLGRVPSADEIREILIEISNEIDRRIPVPA